MSQDTGRNGESVLSHVSCLMSHVWFWNWAVVAAGAAAVLYGLVLYWLDDHYAIDRSLIFVAAGWAAARLWPTAVGRAGTPRPVLAFPLLVGAGVLFLPAWFVFAQIGPRAILFWMEAVAVLLAAAGLILGRFGWPTLFALRFPVLFPLMGLPLPGRIESTVRGLLQDTTTQLAAGGLGVFYPVKRDGYLLHLPHGDLGVVEACSGMQSMTALTAIAVFLAHVRKFGPVRWVVTMLFAVPVIIVCNAGRVVGTGLLQEEVGPHAIVGWKHDALGFAVVLVGLGLIAGFTRLLQGGPPPPGAAPPAETPDRSWGERPTFARLAAGWLGLMAVAAVAAWFVPGLAVTATDKPPFETIPPRLGPWQGSDLTPDPAVVAALGTDTLHHRLYSRLGHDGHAFLMHWRSANGVRDYHHPDVCWPSRGFKLVTQGTEPLVTPAGRTIRVTYREFRRDSERHLIIYWTQEGRRVWTEADERTAISPLFPAYWLARRLSDPAGTTNDDRLVVLVGMPTWDGARFGKAELFDLTGRLADEVYAVCPWADPK
jgi:exosortase